VILDLFLSIAENHSAVIWSAVSGIGGLIGASILSRQRIKGEAAAKLLLEKEKLKDATMKEMTTQETTERAAFRAALMSELADLRKAVKDCEEDRRQLNERITAHSSDLKMLQAECSIMKMQMKFISGNVNRDSAP
jgi:predicted RNase H-like nuclease (RuvC/YqgF family)